MIEEGKIRVFIEGVEKFFNDINKMGVNIGTPYLIKNKNSQPNDFTGIIGISGEYTGHVYFTAPRIMMSHLLVMYGVKTIHVNRERILDLVGEIANTISGNARSEYGENFIISVPAVFEGPPNSVYFANDAYSYVIPVGWNKYTAHIVVCLTK